ncbi:MAG: hypothetical protein JEZ07_13870 [Phycisphaerae bacterium]|nr:hypothetical protein [Phycisphaerae bacterium]
MRLLKNTILIILLGCSVAYSQYYNSQGGHLLDANTRLGSFGINSRRTRIDTLVPRANLYITGNVSSGASFQGAVPYKNQYEFQGQTSSNILSNFRRDSYGVNNFGSRSYQRPYLDDSRSVTALRSGQVFSSSQAFSRGVVPVGASFSSLDRQRLLNNRQNQSQYTRPMNNYSLNIKPILQPLNMNNSTKPWLAGATDIGSLTRPALGDTSKRLGNIDEKADNQLARPIVPESITEDTEVNKRVPIKPVSKSQTENLDYYELTDQVDPADMPGEKVVSDTAKYYDRNHKQLAIQKARTYRIRGKLFMDQGQYYQAANELALSMIYVDNDPATLELQFIANLAGGKYITAAQAMQNLAIASASLPSGKEYFKQRFPDEKAIDEFVKDIDYWYNLNSRVDLLLLKGYVLFESGRLEDARKAMESWPEDQQTIKAQELLIQALK